MSDLAHRALRLAIRHHAGYLKSYAVDDQVRLEACVGVVKDCLVGEVASTALCGDYTSLRAHALRVDALHRVVSARIRRISPKLMPPGEPDWDGLMFHVMMRCDVCWSFEKLRLLLSRRKRVKGAKATAKATAKEKAKEVKAAAEAAAKLPLSVVGRGRLVPLIALLDRYFADRAIEADVVRAFSSGDRGQDERDLLLRGRVLYEALNLPFADPALTLDTLKLRLYTDNIKRRRLA
jgi:hypothetical protein